MTIGKRIKAERQKAGMSQKDLAERAGTSAAMIGHYETGYRRPKFDTLARIADALGISYEEFQGWFNPEDPEAFATMVEDFCASSYDLTVKLKAVGWVESITDTADQYELSNGEESFIVTAEELKQLDRETDSFMEYKIQELRKKKA